MHRKTIEYKFQPGDLVTPKQIDAMEAGPEIDELAARLVMGWKEQTVDNVISSGPYEVRAERFEVWIDADGMGQAVVENFNPSTNIADTQRVWDELIRRGWRPKHDYFGCEWRIHLWHCDHGGAQASHRSMIELALTKAALKAVGKERTVPEQ